MNTWVLIAIAGWCLAIAGVVVHARQLARARRGTLTAAPHGWCIARGVVTSVPFIASLRAGRTSHVLFGALPPDQVWFVREQFGGGVLVFGPPMGVLRLSGGTAQYELRLGLGTLAWVVGVALFLLAVTVVAHGGWAWVAANAGLVLGAVALQVRFERRTVLMLAAEVLRELQQAG